MNEAELAIGAGLLFLLWPKGSKSDKSGAQVKITRVALAQDISKGVGDLLTATISFTYQGPGDTLPVNFSMALGNTNLQYVKVTPSNSPLPYTVRIVVGLLSAGIFQTTVSITDGNNTKVLAQVPGGQVSVGVVVPAAASITGVTLSQEMAMEQAELNPQYGQYLMNQTPAWVGGTAPYIPLFASSRGGSRSGGARGAPAVGRPSIGGRYSSVGRLTGRR